MALLLKNLLVSSKEVDVEYPGIPGFKLKLAFLSRDIMQSIRKKSIRTVFKNRQTIEELNDELFLQLYAQAAIKGWSGLTLSSLELLVPVDISGQDPTAELEYSEENALFLMKNSANFDSFISETVTELGNFPTSSAAK